jgi:hypothetical protein
MLLPRYSTHAADGVAMKLTVDQARKMILDELWDALESTYDNLDDHYAWSAYGGDRDDYCYNATLLSNMLRATSCSPTFDEAFLLQVLEEVKEETRRDPPEPN